MLQDIGGQWEQQLRDIFQEKLGKEKVDTLVDAVIAFFQAMPVMIEWKGRSQTELFPGPVLFCHGGIGTAGNVQDVADLRVPLPEEIVLDKKGEVVPGNVTGRGATILWSDPVDPKQASIYGWR